MKPTSLNLRCPWTKEAQLGNVGIGQMLSLRLSTSSLAITRQNVFSPQWLFNNGEVGWFEPMIAGSGGTLFQDAAGTTPVTAPGQPVGLSLDTSGNGNHFVQSTALNRPIYGIHPITGRRNLLTYTEDLTNAVWRKVNGSVIGTRFTPNTTGAVQHRLDQTPVSSAGPQVFHAVLKYAGYRWVSLRIGSVGASFDILNGVVGTTLPPTPRSITSLGGGLYLCSIYTASAAANDTARITVEQADTIAGDFAGDGVSGLDVIHTQLELGSTATAYQKVVSQYEVTEAGVQSIGYLSHNGSKQWMSTAAFAWGSDKATIVAGVRKLSDAAQAVVFETSAAFASNNGAMTLQAPVGASASFGFGSKGTAASNANVTTGYASPVTAVMTGIGDIANDVARLRINGAQVASPVTDQGTGNYGTHALYAGARAGTTLFFNGNRYPNIGINRLLTAAELAQVEAWVNSKTGAY